MGRLTITKSLVVLAHLKFRSLRDKVATKQLDSLSLFTLVQ